MEIEKQIEELADESPIDIIKQLSAEASKYKGIIAITFTGEQIELRYSSEGLSGVEVMASMRIIGEFYESELFPPDLKKSIQAAREKVEATLRKESAKHDRASDQIH